MKKIIQMLLVMAGIITGLSKADAQTEVIVFHAGSLSVPMKEAAQAFMKKNPGVSVVLESSGSLVCARKVTELKKPCDIVASADYFVINELLIPQYADWGIRFASNRMVIAFTGKSKYSATIDTSNWKDILLRNDVIFSRSDPNSDPCGYRAVFTMKLAELYYNQPHLSDKLLAKNTEYIRPKEVDLVALMEANVIDYMFQYKSVAIQHNLKFIELPRNIDLSDPSYNNYYGGVSTVVTGNTPGSSMTVKGEYINYSLTILKNAPHNADAQKFVAFLLGDEGREIFKKCGQEPITPSVSEQYDKVPVSLRNFLKK